MMKTTSHPAPVGGAFLRGLAAAVFASLATGQVFGFAIYNNTRYAVRVWVPQGEYESEIPPGEHRACNFANTDCNPSGSRTSQLLLIVETVDSTIDYEGKVILQGGGYATIDEVWRGGIGLATRPDIKIDSWTFDHQSLDTTRTGHGDGSLGMTVARDVRFFATADCQYSGGVDGTESDFNGGANGVANDVYARMTTLMAIEPKIRGMLYAGDLTQRSRRDEWTHYTARTAEASRFLFDGLGNHDRAFPTVGQVFQCLVDPTRCRIPETLRADVRDRGRQTVKTNKGDPHYSWDWQDVHFVQLHVFPADEPASDLRPSGDPNIYPEHDPMESLAFLQQDLATRVGNTGRPVVLVHHYGFDDFSTGRNLGCDVFDPTQPHNIWWTDAQRVRYWNALAPYNVVAIITGHFHTPSDLSDSNTRCRWHIPWIRPPGGVGGPPEIQTFIAGAARNNLFIDVRINASNEVSVTQRDSDGVVNEEVCYTFSNRYYVEDIAATPGWGSVGLPFATMAQAVNSVSRRDPNCSTAAYPEIRVAPGSYPESLTIDRKTRITNPGSGTARIGRP